MVLFLSFIIGQLSLLVCCFLSVYFFPAFNFIFPFVVVAIAVGNRLTRDDQRGGNDWLPCMVAAALASPVPPLCSDVFFFSSERRACGYRHRLEQDL